MASWAELYDDAAERLASPILRLLDKPEDWIQRRVEEITITSQRLVRRAMTVDLVLPEAATRRELQLDPVDPISPLVLPLGMQRKAELIDFHLGEGSEHLMFVRSALNARVAAAMIARVAILDNRPRVETKAALPWLKRIAEPNHEVAHQAFKELFAKGFDSQRDHELRTARGLAESESTRQIAEQLRDSYILLIELPDTGTRRRLIQTATDQVVKEREQGSRSITNRLGLTATPIALGIPGASQTASYHAEITVPPGCVVSSAIVLDDAKETPASKRLIGRRATVYVTQPTNKDVELQLQLEVSQERSFYLLPAAVIGTLICVVLSAGVAVAWAGGKPQSTASALLLSGLSTIAGLVIHRDEDSLTAELHGLSRGLLVSVSAATLGAATSIALGATSSTLAALWTVSLFVSVLATSILIAAAIRGTPAKELGEERTT
jgi:hypothetical protein